MIALTSDTILDIKKDDTLVVCWYGTKTFSDVFTLLKNPDNNAFSYWKYLIRRGCIIYLLSEEERNMACLGCCLDTFKRE